MADSEVTNFQYFEKDSKDFDTMFADPSRMKDPMRRLVKLLWKSSGSKGRFEKAAALIPQPIKDKRILEVGCGHGYCSLSLAKMGANVTGLDYSPNMLGLARKNLSRLKAELVGSCDFSEGDVLTYSTAQKVDLVLALGVIDYVHPSKIPSFVEKLVGFSEEWVLIAFPIKFHLFYPVRKFWLRAFKNCHVTHFSRREVVALCDKSKLQIVNEIRYAGYDLCLLKKK
jgi:SAM-dependent methyltransferase